MYNFFRVSQVFSHSWLGHMVKHVALISFSIQDNFQILPVEDNWEKGVRKEFKPFSSEIASQVSLVVSSFHLL